MKGKKDVGIFQKYSIKLCCTLVILQTLLNHQIHKQIYTQKMLFRGMKKSAGGKNWTDHQCSHYSKFYSK